MQPSHFALSLGQVICVFLQLGPTAVGCLLNTKVLCVSVKNTTACGNLYI